MLYINWPGGNTPWTSNDFQTNLVTPLLNMLAARQLTNQIDYVVLSMDIPFQTSFGSVVNGTTSALFYGSRQGDGSDPLGVTNSYAGSEAVFRQATPVGAPGYSFLDHHDHGQFARPSGSIGGPGSCQRRDISLSNR